MIKLFELNEIFNHNFIHNFKNFNILKHKIN